MNNSELIKIHVFDVIPDHLVTQVDQLLEENESNNRIKNKSASNLWSKERFINQKDRYKYIVATISIAVVGITLVFKRTVQYKDKFIILGGLGGVGVKKEYRGRGIGTKMLSTARDILDKSDCDVAFLGTDIQDPQMLKIYGRIGFVPLNKAFVYTGKSGQSHQDPTAGMIAPIHSQELFNQIINDTNPFFIGIGTW